MRTREHRLTRSALAMAACLMLALGAACADDGFEDAGTDADPAGGPIPVGVAGTETLEVGNFPDGGQAVQLTDVRVAAHEGFDRIVLQYEGDGDPSYRIGFIEPPVRQDGSGNEVDVEGEAFLEIRLTPASGFDFDAAEETYSGPDRFTPQDTALLREFVRVGDFEGQLAWVAGVSEAKPFAVETLEDPRRLVVDLVDDP